MNKFVVNIYSLTKEQALKLSDAADKLDLPFFMCFEFSDANPTPIYMFETEFDAQTKAQGKLELDAFLKLAGVTDVPSKHIYLKPKLNQQ